MHGPRIESRETEMEREIEITEVSVRDLSRGTSRILASARRGSRVIVLRHGEPAAALIGIDDALDLFLATSNELVQMRLEARAQLLAGRAAPLDAS
jgi:prevent-host-death family protein